MSKRRKRGAVAGRKWLRRRRPAKERLCRDAQATAAMHFVDRESYVAFDGRVVLYGADAAAAYDRAYEAWDGKCGLCGGFVSFGQVERHHIRSKGKHLRDDRDENQMFVHRKCHNAEHARTLRWSWLPS